MSSQNNYSILAIILGIISFVVYSWFEQKGIHLVINQAINYSILALGILLVFFIMFYFLQNNQFNTKRFKLNKTTIITLIVISILLLTIPFLKINYMNLNIEKITNSILRTITKNLLFIIIAIITSVVVLIITKLFLKRKERIKADTKTLEELEKKTYNNYEDLDEAKNIIKQICNKHRNLSKHLQEPTNKTENILKTKEYLLQKLKLEEKRKREEKRKKEKNNKQIINKIFNYFKEEDTIKTIPIWAKNTEQEIIEEAKRKYYEHTHEQYRQERTKEINKEQEEQAKQFIIKNKALPSNYQELSEEEQNNYDQALKQLEQGTLTKTESYEVEEQDKYLATRRFFLAKELNKEQKERFTKKYGYKHKPFTHLNGKLGNNLIINNQSKTESDYHFCTKHLLAKIDDENSHIEYSIKEMRADAVFKYRNKKIAVEVETGSNNKEQIIKKIEWLNKYFNYWIILAPKKEQKNYRVYVDKKKSFCLGSKKAEQKILELKEQLLK